MITTGQMIALRPARPTLTLFAARQLFDVAMQFFDLPAHIVRVLSDLRGYRLIQVIGDDPVNVTVRGDYLEQPHFERDFLQLDDNAMWALHNAYRRGSNVIVLVVAPQANLDRLRAQGQKLGVQIHRTVWEKELHAVQ